ncbi:unnamed protein product [Adineta steineri]|uniref:AAA+ ATPase domain-containing protein n=1 Tax=Adineta steineri TaxID=433720 RepID=A0A819B2D3_9BILA|nr:unnamed protein product [Adineta steineri]CAF3794519.1 unnamed protein product [Adineta steineri]
MQVQYSSSLKRANRRHVNTEKQSANETELPSQITCYIHVKQNRASVEEFIQQFLLQSLIYQQNNHNYRSHKVHSAISTTTTSPLSSNETRPLARGCVLDMFIRTHLSDRGVVNTGFCLTKLQLAEPLTIEDEFDTWYFDYMRGMFDIWLIPRNTQTFPLKWSINEDTEISLNITSAGIITNIGNNNISTGGNIDRPSTVSLERFINDICQKENNGNTDKWLAELHNEDIQSYTHLANLKFSEWEQMKTLSINARKIIKSYVEREKILSSEVKKTNKSENDSDNDANLISKSQLIAYLHQIKLYFHYILSEQFAQAGIPQPAKINHQCVDLAFDEMRTEGFADDGLFDQMKSFFLPLTMTKKDINATDKQYSQKERELEEKLISLRSAREKLDIKLAEIGKTYYRLSDEIEHMKSISPANLTNSRNNQNDWEPVPIRQQLDDLRNRMNELQSRRSDYLTQWQKENDAINNIQNALENQKHQNNDIDLIKPNRGFIMYGPPGTGKSEIMSKLSARIGITMVAPSMAAGELDRPLVGESERIINDICMRCHRLPYLMCCVAIDEIDSLAPKRTDESRHTDVSKLSVLLSVIEGIKDVRNLMFFCATNRIHMMDKAFLRRMSGEFFVGRPSSHARKLILSGIKWWHLNPEMLEDLTMATTNFSGAALRALRRSITTHCINAFLTNESYEISKRTVLEHAHEMALKYRIMIGAETLPALILRTLNQSLPVDRWNVEDKPGSVYSGKILINLSMKKVYVEATITENNNEQKKIVYQDKLTEKETDLQGLIERLVYYGKSRNVQLLQLIDLNLLLGESAYNEEKKFEILRERVEEFTSYRRSMIVFDLDSLIGVNKSEAYAALGNSTNVSLVNHNVNIYIQEQFRYAYCQPPSSTNEKQEKKELDKLKEKWSVIVVRDPYLYKQFCNGDHQFTRPPEEIQEEEMEHRRAEEKNICAQCKDYYTEQDNKMGQCVHHDGFVYDCSSFKLETCGQAEAIQKLVTEEAQLLNRLNNNNITNEQKERHEKTKQRFKFICCNQTVQTSGNMGGCKKGKHQILTDNEWESLCNHNEYYINKWNKLSRAFDANNGIANITQRGTRMHSTSTSNTPTTFRPKLPNSNFQ